jgi:15-cis-phytoene synthase
LERAALVAAAQQSIARGSKSFAMASRLFDPKTRERAWLLYSWCRKCDDIADGQDGGGAMSVVDDPHERLAFIRTMTDRALSGEVTGDPAFDALALVATECRIPPKWPRDLVQGFAMDADGFSPETEADLLLYCYHVAGVVGLMMAVVMGVDPEDKETLTRANDLGLAFQLANIARDIGEDEAAGRCYLPAQWRATQSRAQMAQRLATMAEGYEASARIGAKALPFRARWAVLAAAGIYGDIARKVARRGDRAWDTRVYTSSAAKVGWVARSFFGSIFSTGHVRRPPELWSHAALAQQESRFDTAVSDIRLRLVDLGIRDPIDLDLPIIKGLGLDDEDWAMDFLTSIEHDWKVDLRPLLETDTDIPRGFLAKLMGWPTQKFCRDVSAREIAEYIAASTASDAALK